MHQQTTNPILDHSFPPHPFFSPKKTHRRVGPSWPSACRSPRTWPWRPWAWPSRPDLRCCCTSPRPLRSKGVREKLVGKPWKNHGKPRFLAGNRDKIGVRLSEKCKTVVLTAKTGHVKLGTFSCCEALIFFLLYLFPKTTGFKATYFATSKLLTLSGFGWQLIQAIHSTLQLGYILFLLLHSHPSNLPERANYPSSCARDLCRAPRC